MTVEENLSRLSYDAPEIETVEAQEKNLNVDALSEDAYTSLVIHDIRVYC